MLTLGDIKLKFGPTGEDGEEPLHFKSGHINLLVGPNNAGKSLMLRELSGVNPRSARREWRKPEYEKTRIIASVELSEEAGAACKEGIIRGLFSGSDNIWSVISPPSWDQFVPALDLAIPRLTEIRDQLLSTLLGILRTNLDAEISAFIPEQSVLDMKAMAPLLIGGAIALLGITRSVLDIPTTEVATNAKSKHTKAKEPPLTHEKARALQALLESTWAQCESVFLSIGVNTTGTTIESLINPRAMGGVLLSELSKHPILGPLIKQMLASPRITIPSKDTVERFERLTIIGSWFIDPEPLSKLARLLRDTYTELTWANHEQRAEGAKAALYLDGLARLEMTHSAKLKAYEERDEGDSPILVLHKDPERLGVLRSLVSDALGSGVHLVIDMVTQAPQVIWRIAKEAPEAGSENNYSGAANDFLKSAALLEERSDGIHAFVGMLAAILAKSSDTVYIDEPEAFLHPPLVRKFARQLTTIAKDLDWQFFIATHSADLLASCASVGADVNIIRLTHSGTRSTARLLDSATLRELALDPLLRSESTLSALFHDGAVVCEAAADRVLYQEANERLLLYGEKERDGLESCVFLNAQNWQTVARMIKPLRKMGVAAAAVLDADVLFGSELSVILESAQVPKILSKGWLQQRGDFREKLAKRLKAEVKELQLKGKIIAKLTRGERKIFDTLRASMAEYGVFLVPVGELEDWLSDLSLKNSADKNKWLRAALDRLGVDPDTQQYVRPGDGDIWQFMREVNSWILNPDREGTAPASKPED